MKIRTFTRLYCPYIIVCINSIILLNAYYQFILVIFLLYIFLFNQLHKKGFITVIFYLLVIGLNTLMFVISDRSFIDLSTSLFSILCGVLFLHTLLPIRTKVRNLVKQINLNKSLIIYHNRIEQDNSIIGINSDFRQSEIEWLWNVILFKSSTLTRIEETIIDNEIFGQHIQMNIV